MITSSGVRQPIYVTFVDFNQTRGKPRQSNMRSMDFMLLLSNSLLIHLQCSTLGNIVLSLRNFSQLSSIGHQSTGKVRKGCINSPPLESDVILEKTKSGSFDYQIDGNVNIV
ncbi:UNVERIFIED_CONTAM: PiggyBac transposable element-derived protein 3 [Trichonephila clavipes]